MVNVLASMTSYWPDLYNETLRASFFPVQEICITYIHCLPVSAILANGGGHGYSHTLAWPVGSCIWHPWQCNCYYDSGHGLSHSLCGRLAGRPLGIALGAAAIARMVRAVQQCPDDLVVWIADVSLQHFDHPN